MRSLYLITGFLLLSIASFAQDRLLTVNFQQANVKQVVTAIEAQSDYYFYYDALQFDSLHVTMVAERKPLTAILDEAFKNTPYKYAINNRQVFLTKGRAVDVKLADQYFSSVQAGTQPVNNVTPVVAAAVTDEVKPKAVEALSENKTYNIGIPTNTITPGKATVAGYVRDAKSGEPVVGASIYVPSTQQGVATDGFGYYSISLPKGPNTLQIKGLGMKDTRRQLMVFSDGRINIEMQEQVTSLKEVKISAEKVANVRSTDMGVTKLDIKSIKQVPTVFGETDVLRVVLTLPGVQSVGEASTGFNVRGGAADQNLILFNDATIYNPAHFFGFFSAFDPDLVKDVELYKSTIPEKYGGRLSSVLEVNNREGNRKKYTGSGSLGLLTSRFYIEGPIDTNKTSFIFGGRTTYADWLLKSLQQPSYRNSSASFYDLNLGISHQINERNQIYLSAYTSSDGFKLNGDTSYNYGNTNLSLKWRHTFNNKLYGVFGGGYDYYQYGIKSDVSATNAYKFNFNIRQLNFRTDFTYYLNPKNTINVGLNSILYKLNPGSNLPWGDKSLVRPDIVPAEQALESALYIGNKMDVTQNLSMSLGMRFSMFNYLGPQTVNIYAPGQPTTEFNVIGSKTYNSGSVIKTYGAPEIRTSIRYILSEDFSVKASFNTLRQYIHLLSNTTAISPTDVWKLSDNNIKPQMGSQVSLGLYRNFKSNTIETSVEVYYKTLNNYLDYRSGAKLVLNQNIENDVLPVKGKSYGVEFFLKKSTGKLNGWLSYTYSRILLQQNNTNLGELINRGEWYPANYDKPHSVNLIGNYRFSHRYSISFNGVYSTGRPITLPITRFYYAGSERIYYSDRNQYRIPDYFRFDLSATFEPNHRVNQRFHSSWTLGVYNLTGRHNPYSTYYVSEGGKVNGYQLSIFAAAIPFVNYNIRF
ncbi:TonB-dependent receptor [Mucilaginibacter auburnensis]|uniref:TonB-dependent receptor-like protein n=1 Tax=Mucilaginibacter auburnensis TaxID=1457233 RepID=A0A2H9VVP4_9SPHI|nr:TonB-dependent receptor [Mucilaginibacter auburnensis]PJJ84888.1 TonB-dependent receptor-like protein [Mucilaginibacter auburnensis]